MKNHETLSHSQNPYMCYNTSKWFKACSIPTHNVYDACESATYISMKTNALYMHLLFYKYV